MRTPRWVDELTYDANPLQMVGLALLFGFVLAWPIGCLIGGVVMVAHGNGWGWGVLAIGVGASALYVWAAKRG